MSRHVVVSLAVMPKEGVPIRHEAGKEPFEVAPHFGVGILLNQQGSGRVLQMKCDQAVVEARILDEFLDGISNFGETASWGRQGEFMEALLHKISRFGHELLELIVARGSARKGLVVMVTSQFLEIRFLGIEHS